MKYYRGRYRVKNPKKYKGDVNNVEYRSSWELKFMKWCDFRDDVLEWSSEEIMIKYLHPVDGKYRRYFPDFYVKLLDKFGNIQEYVVEIKPKSQTKEPERKTKKLTRRYINEVITYATNDHKWEAAIEWCKKRNYKFAILTEDHLAI